MLIIEPGRSEKNYWTDLWRYRELFLILAWRDISVRYKQTIIGILWAIIRPFLTMVVPSWMRPTSSSDGFYHFIGKNSGLSSANGYFWNDNEEISDT